MTQVLQLDAKSPRPEVNEQAAAVIRAGGLVAFPTETVYGLGADALNEAAVARIFEAKGRPSDNPLIIHVAGREMLDVVATGISKNAERLIERFWPGPLTIVFQRQPVVPFSISAGLPTVAVRMPKHEVALALIRASKTPIAAPSANRSGKPSPTLASHVLEDLRGQVDLILDAGATEIGVESTVLDMTVDPPVILRPGWVTPEMLNDVIGPIGSSGSEELLNRSPGTRHRHYSPRAQLILIEEMSPEQELDINARDEFPGLVVFIGHSNPDIDDSRFPRFHTIQLGRDPHDYAHSIYAALREADRLNPDLIIVEGISDSGEGAAVMDRLRRAASGSVAVIGNPDYLSDKA
jgi:L-threonylcarbamoyladenylate synthase